MIAASILQARGFRNFKEIEGGFNAIAKTELPKTDFVCQTKDFITIVVEKKPVKVFDY
jgi:hypothetical protein